ncbi:MAG: hypothetical protein M5U26_05210 [Planctomycetota bacterium]|nr:hypothetical protein [Planctomycetota bacterium]
MWANLLPYGTYQKFHWVGGQFERRGWPLCFEHSFISSSGGVYKENSILFYLPLLCNLIVLVGLPIFSTGLTHAVYRNEPRTYGFRIHLLTMISLSMALGLIVFLNTIEWEVSKNRWNEEDLYIQENRFGRLLQTRGYGWPLPAIEVIVASSYRRTGQWIPFNLALDLLVSGLILLFTFAICERHYLKTPEIEPGMKG